RASMACWSNISQYLNRAPMQSKPSLEWELGDGHVAGQRAKRDDVGPRRPIHRALSRLITIHRRNLVPVRRLAAAIDVPDCDSARAKRLVRGPSCAIPREIFLHGECRENRNEKENDDRERARRRSLPRRDQRESDADAPR